MKTVLVLSAVLAAAVAATQMNLQYPEEWQLWKSQHGKSYGSQREELDRHLVWVANREYINVHNKNSHIFGFTLAMNHFGDMVNYSCVSPLLTSDIDGYRKRDRKIANIIYLFPD